jgi:ribosomal small subunit protein bTHX
MGKGDKKTKRGKIFRSSYGKTRPRKRKKKVEKFKNMVCYMSKEKLTKKNMSLEHVIPNALGGRLKSYHLINADWNDKFGRTIDAELVKKIPLPTILGIKRERGNNPKVKAETEDGVRYLLDENVEGRRRPTAPVRTKLPSGLNKIEFIEDQEEEILKSIKKKYPHIDTNELKKQIKWDDNPKRQIVFFENDLNMITGDNAFKAICKIACNFYVLSTNEITQIQQVVPFLEGKDKGLGRLKYYYPNKEIHKLGDAEISHLIHIESNVEDKLLYAYVELFSCHSILVILNDDYKGESINHTYCYDVNNNKEIHKKINLNLTNSEIAKMIFPQDKDSEKEYFKRLNRIAKIRGLEIEERRKDELKKPPANNG